MNQKQSPEEEAPNEFDQEFTGEENASPHSVSRSPEVPQPIEGTSSRDVGERGHGEPGTKHDNEPLTGPGSSTAPAAVNPCAHVVLYQPEIPQNTGNIGRTCVAVGAKLWIVRPAAFRIDDARLRRAGLDYWQHLDLGDAVNWDDLVRQLAPRRMFFLSRFAKRTLWDVSFDREDVFVFGRESSGLPATILDPETDQAIRLPTSMQVRSLNLATTVGIVLYEQQRQLLVREGRVVGE